MLSLLPSSSGARMLALSIGIAGLSMASGAEAACETGSGLHSCLNADQLWPHAGPGPFMAMGGTELTAKGAIGFGLVTTYLSKPITLSVPSAQSSELTVGVVDDMVNVGLSLSAGLTDSLELSAALPVTLYQNGSGIAPYASSRPASLPKTALRDPRIGFAYRFLPRSHTSSAEGFALAGRLDMSLPFGQKSAFASEPGPVFGPTIAADFRSGPWFAGAEIGLRARSTSLFATRKMGSQAFIALGTGFDIVGETLAVAVEAFALPVLVSQPSGELLLPAEWLAEIQSAPLSDSRLRLALGGGSAIPLSDSALTAPRWRILLSVRYELGLDSP